MRAVGYPRVSTNGQDYRGQSLGDQISQIEQFCESQGIQLVAHFLEVESAATVSARPSFKAALKHLYHSDVDAIIVTNLDRHSRSVLDAEIIRRSLAKRGKRIISIQEQYLTPFGQDVDPEFEDYLESALQHRMVEAEQERKRIRRRTIRGRKAKANKGGWIGFRPPYEYDVIQGELVLNWERHLTIRHIRRLRKYLGWGFPRIANYLNDRLDRFPAPSSREPIKKRQRPSQFNSGRWNRGSLHKMFCITQRDWGDNPDRLGQLRAV